MSINSAYTTYKEGETQNVVTVIIKSFTSRAQLKNNHLLFGKKKWERERTPSCAQCAACGAHLARCTGRQHGLASGSAGRGSASPWLAWASHLSSFFSPACLSSWARTASFGSSKTTWNVTTTFMFHAWMKQSRHTFNKIIIINSIESPTQPQVDLDPQSLQLPYTLTK